MSTLKSYSFGTAYGVNELPVHVIKLFGDMTKYPDLRIEHANEIIEAGIQGKIDSEKFILSAYEKGIQRKEQLAKRGRYNKYKNVNFLEDKNTDLIQTYSCYTVNMSDLDADDIVSMNSMIIEDEYEKLLNKDELEYAVEQIKSLQYDILVYDQIDFIGGLKDALKGIPNSVAVIKELCDKYEYIKDLIQIILKANISLDTYLV